MGTNTHYVPQHAGTYSQSHDFSNDTVESVYPKHIRTGIMAGFRPTQTGSRR